MHTREYEGYTIHYNGGFDGDVHIIEPGGGAVMKLKLPFSVLRDFVADYVRDTRISCLEDADSDELLGVLPPAD